MLIFFVKIPKHYTEHPHDYLEQGPTHPPLDITLEHSKGKQPSHGNLPGHGTSTTELSIYFAQQRKLKPYSFLLEKKKQNPIDKQKKNKPTPVIPPKNQTKIWFLVEMCVTSWESSLLCSEPETTVTTANREI